MLNKNNSFSHKAKKDNAIFHFTLISKSWVSMKLRKIAILSFMGLLIGSCSTPENQGSPESVVSAPDSTESPASTPDNPEPVTAEKKTADSFGVRVFVDEQGLAIRGTDPVAYFTEGRPVPGQPDFTYTWNDVNWQFSSAENRDQFAANPEQYAPQYGGFCALAVSQGKLATTDPEAWKIVDGKLYLNYSREKHNIWEQDIAGNIQKANENWTKDLGTGG